MVGGMDVYRHDMEIPRKYGVDQRIGDTLGPGGVFRFLRNVPAYADIAADMHEVCPNALLINYANPMAMNCWYLTRAWDHDRGSLPQRAGHVADAGRHR